MISDYSDVDFIDFFEAELLSEAGNGAIDGKEAELILDAMNLLQNHPKYLRGQVPR